MWPFLHILLASALKQLIGTTSNLLEIIFHGYKLFQYGNHFPCTDGCARAGSAPSSPRGGRARLEGEADAGECRGSLNAPTTGPLRLLGDYRQGQPPQTSHPSYPTCTPPLPFPDSVTSFIHVSVPPSQFPPHSTQLSLL